MKRILYIFSLFSLLSSAFAAQEDPFTALLKKLEEFTKKHPQEKVYLHLDKPYYAVGEPNKLNYPYKVVLLGVILNFLIPYQKGITE